ncbi:MAG: hypothetical protein Q8M05_06285 [Rhodoferax sp.]|jgi:hypothetical protein|uniref:hypothetical protein n=1 Tax=Rhodoferax sp. TaxID=50421 RepID=UPI0027314B86|nr:hypothetical protein [Rhodoferax sp.]MDP1528970.1 hypothetical protein [Rhodoferax sp.]MDP3190836.1 hypothetical protein [Rhodoferax sp.]MDP3338579.1 hypothetical protein [Rhodoferax sp.]
MVMSLKIESMPLCRGTPLWFQPGGYTPRPADFNQRALPSILKFSEQNFIAMEKPA